MPADIFGQFIAPALTAFVSFALMGFYSSLIPSLILESLHIRNHATSGAAIFFMFCSGVIAIAVSRRFSSRAVVFTALATLVPGVLLPVAARKLSSLALLFAASAIGGVSGALGYRGSLAIVNEIAPKDRRAETLAVLMLCCYTGISLPIIGIGIATQKTRPGTADLVFAVLLCVLALIAIAMGLNYGGTARSFGRPGLFPGPVRAVKRKHAAQRPMFRAQV